MQTTEDSFFLWGPFHLFAFFGNLSWYFCCLLIFFKINFFKKICQRIKKIGSRSRLTFWGSWAGSKLFAKFISRKHMSLMAGKKVKLMLTMIYSFQGWCTEWLRLFQAIAHCIPFQFLCSVHWNADHFCVTSLWTNWVTEKLDNFHFLPGGSARRLLSHK